MPIGTPIGPHPSHVTRISDASTYDEICVNCGAHDEVPGGWGMLAYPCPNQPRVYTLDEARKAFIDHLWFLIDYWNGNLSEEKTQRERIAGAVFSILVTLDGCSDGMPSFSLIPSPNADDERNNFPMPPELPSSTCDLSGGLHELFHGRNPELARNKNSK